MNFSDNSIMNNLSANIVTKANNFVSKGSSTLETIIIMSVFIPIILALILMMENIMLISHHVSSCNFKSYYNARKITDTAIYNSTTQEMKAKVVMTSFVFNFFMKGLSFEDYPYYSIVSHSTYYNNYRVLRVANNAAYIVKRLICLSDVIKKEADGIE